MYEYIRIDNRLKEVNLFIYYGFYMHYPLFFKKIKTGNHRLHCSSKYTYRPIQFISIKL